MAAEQLAGSFVKIDDSSSQTPTETSVYQYIDVLKSDINASANRKNYEVFVTGATGQANVTSTLYQTIFDQDFTLSTSNPMLDLTVGLLKEEVNNNPVINGVTYSYDSAGKIVGFNNDELMIREKVNIYRQFAQNLLGDPDASFVAPHGESADTAGAAAIKSALFICFRRLFTRDNIHKGTFNLAISRQTPFLLSDAYSDSTPGTKGSEIANVFDVNHTDDSSLVDLIEVSDLEFGNTSVAVSPVSGQVSTLTATINNTSTNVGLIYYDKGIVVLDTEVLFDNTQTLRGLIDSTQNTVIEDPAGPWHVEDSGTHYKDLYTTQAGAEAVDTLDPPAANSIPIGTETFYQPKNLADPGSPTVVISTPSIPTDQPSFDLTDVPSNIFYSDSSVTADATEATSGVRLFSGTLKEFITQGTIEDILTHLCSVRFSDQNESAITYQNESIINSKIYYCRAAPSQLNYSTNPTYTDTDGNIVALEGNRSFSFVTSVGLFDSTGTLVAVAKTSRPIEKNSETDLTINVRLDY